MKYYIGHLMEGKAKRYYDELVKNISSRFVLEKLSQKSRIPHVTFKSPFDVDSSIDIYRILEEFAKDQSLGSFQVCGFGHFAKEVIYLDLSANKRTRNNIGELLRKLRSIPSIPFEEYDHENKNLHITVVKGAELQNRFEDVWAYLVTLNTSFQIPFDNVTLFRKENGKTLVEKTFDYSTPK